jgi:hypothetical protein
MSLKNIYSLFKTLEKESILLSFKGVVTADLSTSVLQIMETKLTYMQESSRMKKKVFNIMVECLQNLFHHIGEQDIPTEQRFGAIDVSSAMFMVARVGDSFYIRTGNYIENADAEDLEMKLEIINGLDTDGLRLYYQGILKNGAVSLKGTAGLGMIDIARKSGNKLEFEFIDIENGLQFFCLNVKID